MFYYQKNIFILNMIYLKDKKMEGILLRNYPNNHLILIDKLSVSDPAYQIHTRSYCRQLKFGDINLMNVPEYPFALHIGNNDLIARAHITTQIEDIFDDPESIHQR